MPNLEPDSVESSSQTISQIEASQDDETGESSNEYEVTSKWPEFKFLEPDTIVCDTQTIEWVLTVSTTNCYPFLY